MSKDSESALYGKLGASSSKAGILKAASKGRPQHFIELCNDLVDSDQFMSFIHADGAGTKSILAYIAFKETNDPTYFRGLAQDALVMNLDDIICVGLPQSLLLSNTIGRCKRLVPDSAIAEIINGYGSLIYKLSQFGINIMPGGGETADVGDVVRTLLVDATLAGRIEKTGVISTDNIKPNDVIVGLSSTGQASYEDAPNSGISSNGLTLARHVLIPNEFCKKYPEIMDPGIDDAVAYKGKFNIFENRSDLGTSIIKAILSPTRTYAPILAEIYRSIGTKNIHGVINCTGGGQTKPLRFGQKVRYVKDSLFPVPPLFSMIQSSANVPWREMYSVFNMGHRLEIIVPQAVSDKIIGISKHFNVEAKIIGRIEESDTNSVSIITSHGTFYYQ